ncbi:MAG TPA: DUF4236 domain-containing protein, partial [Candidatus Dormibacteraeota bacterium]|nr:DUF4236 domain-containing protein [Candidatus Dormibacteraeota bacterium]
MTLNVSKRGISTSIGPRGAKFTVGRRGARGTVGLPGTGVFYTQQLGPAPHAPLPPPSTAIP